MCSREMLPRFTPVSTCLAISPILLHEKALPVNTYKRGGEKMRSRWENFYVTKCLVQGPGYFYLCDRSIDNAFFQTV